MSNIHPTAIVSPKAEIGENANIGPYVIIHDDVVIGNDAKIESHACIYDGARIGNNVHIFQGASISNLPQDVKFNKEAKTYFYIGNNTVIREFVSLHRGTEAHGFSKIGDNCYLMAYSHVAHDCEVGNNVILVNSVNIGGHCTIEDWVIIGGSTPVHQFCKIGQHAMIGGGFRVVSDVPPFVLGGSEPLKFSGLNVVGLRRRGFSNQTITDLKQVYTYIYNSGLNLSQAKQKIMNEFAGNEYAEIVLNFINNSKRGII